MDGVLEALKPLAQEQTGLTLIISTAGSGTLAQQIISGAPADLFISANPQWMDELALRGRLEEGTRIDLAGNRLVLICGDDLENPPASLASLAGFNGHIAIGQPTSVPAGQYAKQALENLGIWEEVEPDILPTMDVQAALAYVAGGEADLGIVYATDPPTTSSGVRILLTIPPHLHDPIRYPAAVLKDAANPAAARRLLEWLQSDAAATVFEEHRFVDWEGAPTGK